MICRGKRQLVLRYSVQVNPDVGRGSPLRAGERELIDSEKRAKFFHDAESLN